VKYDSDGNELWVARAEMHGTERGKALGVDPWGNVIVTGSASLPSDYPIGLTVKYDSLGNELWRAVFEWMNPPADLVVDSAGCVYVFGTLAGSYTDFCTVKYDPDGRECWVRTYNGPGNGWDDPQAMAIDSLANIYVTGWSTGSSTGYDFCTIKYDSAGNEKWVARYDSGGETDWPSSIATNGSDVYVVGYSFGKYCVIRYTVDGELLWSALWPPDSGGGDAIDVTVDACGNAYVTGYSIRQESGADYLTSKFEPNGVGLAEGERGKRAACPLGGATVLRGPELARMECLVVDALGRDVTERRGRLAPGVYFLKDEGGRLKGEPGSREAVRKVIVER
jgi:hypothetical protein